jgi:hypothetical protein
LEYEEWKPSRDAPDKADRKIFDDLFDAAKRHSMAMTAAIPACPIWIRLIFVSVLLSHYKELERMAKTLQDG